MFSLPTEKKKSFHWKSSKPIDSEGKKKQRILKGTIQKHQIIQIMSLFKILCT